MGGATTVVEALARGRTVVGSDLNSLSLFVAQAKTGRLSARERDDIAHWVTAAFPRSAYHSPALGRGLICPTRTKNLSLPRARPIKKVLTYALAALDELDSAASKRFARCVLLNVAQWALNNRKRPTALTEFRARAVQVAEEMLEGMSDFSQAVVSNGTPGAPHLYNVSAADLHRAPVFASGARAKLVVTSPPYPGIHILYHRWQVDGRRETPAPYWIAGCLDGQGGHYYNFGSRKEHRHDTYFDNVVENMSAVRQCVSDDALIVQMVAFSRPAAQLARYLRAMTRAGFQEVRPTTSGGKAARRIRRLVPSRAWHATSKGKTSSAQEIVLIHRPT